MKIIMPILNRSTIADGFHNTDNACIYDTATRSYEWISTTSISKVAGNLTLELKKKGITTVLSSYMPALALNLFIESGLTVYKTVGNNIAENIYFLNCNALRPIRKPEGKINEDCSGACSSCSSTCN